MILTPPPYFVIVLRPKVLTFLYLVIVFTDELSAEWVQSEFFLARIGREKFRSIKGANKKYLSAH